MKIYSFYLLGISVVVDHSNDEQVEALFDQIKTENNGRLDVLVNNAYAGVETIFTSMQKKLKFYDMDPSEQWDSIVDLKRTRLHFSTIERQGET